jgi:hypothetical protein
VFTCQTGPINEVDAPAQEEAQSLATVADASRSSVISEPVAPIIPFELPVASERTRLSQDQAAGIPWPAFAPVDAVSPQSTRVVKVTTVPWPVFAPIDPTAVPNSSVQSLVSATAPERCSSTNGSWGQAVDLTRKAMCAWIGVLHGSTPVEVTAR